MDLITVTRQGDRRFLIGVRRHQVVSDMSEKEGGRDAGPSPVELLAGSLGACIAMMVQAYCDRHGYTDGDVAVSLTLELADNPKRIGSVVVDLELPKDVPEDKKEVVRRVAQRCPVHETLRNPPRVDLDILG
ncbi:MAG TPA: OsmC family peroxiredoxin [Planctomycetes bacterium]|nr:OsmC family peroxiredoxin [Planctomycetota bacterium]